MMKDNPYGILFLLCRKTVKCSFSQNQLPRFINVSRELTRRNLGGDKMVILFYDPMADNRELFDRINKGVKTNSSDERIPKKIEGSANAFFAIDGQCYYFTRFYLTGKPYYLSEDNKKYSIFF